MKERLESIPNWKYITVFVAIPIVICLGYFAYQNSTYRIERLGYDLLRLEKISDWRSNRNNPCKGIVNIGPRLYGVLKSRKQALENYTIIGKRKDCSGASQWGMYSVRIIGPENKLCIRLRWDSGLQKYHIVGYTGKI